jgi:hypothetical protein
MVERFEDVRAGVLVVRMWRARDETGGLRIRILETHDLVGAGATSMIVSDIDDASRVVRDWLESVEDRL